MYTEHFGLKEKPFNLTPSPRFLYLSESHKEALALLTYGVTERKGFVLLTGEVGTGKTTILNTLLGTLDKRVQCVHLSNPLLSPADFIDYLSHAVFKDQARVKSKTEFLLRFEAYLRKSLQQQSNFLLVIDEAQKLSFELLEEIRLLSNMETADDKLINIFLVGQPELNQKLSETQCRPLLQRISIRHHISPMTPKETGEYIVTRLKVAGAKDANWIFPATVIRALHQYSKGYPRIINILADNALLSAYSNGTKKITPRMIEQCYGALQLEGSSLGAGQNSASWPGPGTRRSDKSSGKIWRWAVGACVLLASAATVFSWNESLVRKIVPATQKSIQLQDAYVPVPMVMLPVTPPMEENMMAGAATVTKPAPVKEAEEAEPVGVQNPAPLLETGAEFPSMESPLEAQRWLTAKKGDTLSKLAVEVYGKVDDRILSMLQKSNPSIANIHLISVGQEIYFPRVRALEGDG